MGSVWRTKLFVAVAATVLGGNGVGAFATVHRKTAQPPTMISLQAQAEATFGMGCFWKPAEEMKKVPGVIDTVAGYTGIASADKPPSYEQVCYSSQPWVEGVRVIYDDDQVTYTQLLDAFFDAQEPRMGSRQYASIIFPHNDQQEGLARDWLEANASKVRSDGVSPAFTTIESPRSPFFRAENYHQRYWEKTRPRLALMVVLLALSSGVADDYVSATMASQIHTATSALSLAGLCFVLLERKLDTKVVQLD